MVPPFAADNEDDVIDEFLIPTTSTTSPRTTEAAEEEKAPEEVLEMDEDIPDDRTHMEKKVDGDATNSDEDDDKSKSSTLNKMGSAKKPRQAVTLKKKDKTSDFVDALLAVSRDKSERAAVRGDLVEQRHIKKFTIQQKTLDLEAKKHQDNHELQLREMRLREEEMKLRQQEMEMRRLELKAMLAKKKTILDFREREKSTVLISRIVR